MEWVSPPSPFPKKIFSFHKLIQRREPPGLHIPNREICKESCVFPPEDLHWLGWKPRTAEATSVGNIFPFLCLPVKMSSEVQLENRFE